MATLDRVMQMQQQGMSDSDIIYSLQNEGISSREINEALSQAKIKTAVNQPSQETEGYDSQGQYPQDPNAQYSQQGNYQDQGQYQQYNQDMYNQTPQAYSDQGYYQQDQGMSTQMVSDIVERLLVEKMKEINQKMKNTSDFKIKADEDLHDLKERIKRIESTIENLQRSVIGKVGEFGQSTALIHKDLENLHNTVGKLMNPLVDNYNELKKANSKTKKKTSE